MCLGFLPLGETGRPAAQVILPQIAFTSVAPDSEAPSKEYGLPDREDGLEQEEEGDGEGELFTIGLAHPPIVRPASSRAGFAIANRWVLGLGPDARVPYPRC